MYCIKLAMDLFLIHDTANATEINDRIPVRKKTRALLIMSVRYDGYLRYG